MTFFDYVFYRICKFYVHTLRDSYDVVFSAVIVLSMLYVFNLSVVYQVIDLILSVTLPSHFYIEITFALIFLAFNYYTYFKVKNLKDIEEKVWDQKINQNWQIGATAYFTISFLSYFTFVVIETIKNN